MFSNECSKVNVGGYYLILIEFLSLWGFFTTSKESRSHGLSLEDRERQSFFMGTSFTSAKICCQLLWESWMMMVTLSASRLFRDSIHVQFMSSHQLPHPYQNPEYAPPVLRIPSPTSSVGTTYGPDQTSFSDTELSQPAFENKWLAKLNLNKPRKEEEEADEDPLILRPKSKEEESGSYLFFTLFR